MSRPALVQGRAIAVLAVLGILASRGARAFCPCYTLSSAYNTYKCGVEAAPGTNPTVAAWQPIFSLVAQGPAVWGTAGPKVGPIGQGCGKPEKLHDVPARFPCELLQAIAMQESSWRQFCHPDTPKDQGPDPERTLIAFDCGYGVGQVTSGMHIGETPAFDRARVASDPTYNLAAGTLILADKWRATACVGDNQPSIVEDWYVATWAYNGLAYVNNPNNPNLDAGRGVWDPKVGGKYAYQERIWGWLEHPPSPAYWQAMAPAYPNPASIGGGSKPADLPEPDCASPTDCVHHRPVHLTACGALAPPDMAMGAPDLGAQAPDLAAPPAGDALRPLDDGGDGAGGASSDGGSDGASVRSGCSCAVAAGGRRSAPFGGALGALLAAGLARRRRRGPR